MAMTKRSNLTDAFLRQAVVDPLGALATQFMAAFGVDLSALMSVAEQVITAKDQSVFMMAITAAVQIRANVVFVGRDFANIRTRYPVLVIEGDRPQNDIFNFGALHALGHIFCHITNNDWGYKVIAKVGSCITGELTPATDAGKINKEVADSWGASDKAAFGAWLNNLAGRDQVDAWFAGIEGLKRNFGAPARPAPPSTTSSSKTG